jgi:parallel beta-helix repeat protein
MRAKKFFFKIFLGLFLLCTGFFPLENNTIVNYMYPCSYENNFQESVRIEDYWILDSITIDGAATGGGAHNWFWAVSQPWCNGSGTLNYPYIIENITIYGGESEYCINIKNSDKHFIIRNCTFYNASDNRAGIKLDNVKFGTILNNSCYDNGFCGIFLNKSFYCQIINNTIYNNGYNVGTFLFEYSAHGGGVVFWSSHNNSIQYNTFKSNKDFGIALGYTITYHGISSGAYPCYNNSISNNVFIYTELGYEMGFWELPNTRDNLLTDNIFLNSRIALGGSFNTKLFRNNLSNGYIIPYGPVEAETSYFIDTSNTVNGKPVYYYANKSNLNKNNFPDAGQVILVNCRNSIIENASLSDCHYFILDYCYDIILKKNELNCKIYLDNSNFCKIIENSFDNEFQVNLWQSNNTIVSKNLVNNSSSRYDIMVFLSNYNIISENTLLNSEFGFFFGESPHNEISNNYIKLNKTSNYSNNLQRRAIFLDSNSYNNSIFKNHITGSEVGIFSSSYNIISQNYIENTDIGIYLGGSYNTITHNIIIARNACISVNPYSNNNIFENNYCILAENQIIPGFLPPLIFLIFVLISLQIYFHKHRSSKKIQNSRNNRKL